MGNVGQFDSQRMHTQLVGKGDFRELTAREDVLRNRGINGALGIGCLLCFGYVILSLRFGLNELTWWALGIGIILLLVLLYRFGHLRKLMNRRRQQRAPQRRQQRRKPSRKQSSPRKRSSSRGRSAPRRKSSRGRSSGRRRRK